MPLCISLSVIYPSAETDHVYVGVCVQSVIGNVVFKGDDYSGPCGLQVDKVMMAVTFSAISSQSS